MMIQAQQTYSIPVATMKNSENYSYSATDTVQALKAKIYANEGIPEDQQRLCVQYGWRKKWAQVDISDLTTDLLINHLQSASKVYLYLRLRTPHTLGG